MSLGRLTAAAVLALSLAACGRSGSETADTSASPENAAAVKAAAEANTVTSIPGYTPGSAAGGNETTAPP